MAERLLWQAGQRIARGRVAASYFNSISSRATASAARLLSVSGKLHGFMNLFKRKIPRKMKTEKSGGHSLHKYSARSLEKDRVSSIGWLFASYQPDAIIATKSLKRLCRVYSSRRKRIRFCYWLRNLGEKNYVHLQFQNI